MSWDETNPAISRDINLGAGDIRHEKADLRQFLAQEHVSLVDFSSSLTGFHNFPSGATSARATTDSHARRIYLNSEKNRINVENFGDSSPYSSGWYSGGAPIFIGGGVVKMAFYMAAPPTGWTAVAVNDMFLRIVTSGTTGGTTGGTMAASTSLAYAHTIADHLHSISLPVPVDSSLPGGAAAASTPIDTGSTSLTMSTIFSGSFAYADFCIGSFD